MQVVDQIDWFKVISELLAGLALFLFGMNKMTESLKLIAGDKMKDILGSLSNNRVMGFITGIIASGVMQSSTVVSVMLVSFVTSKFMNFAQAFSILLGVQIGATFVSQIVAFKVTKYALLMIAGGFFMFTFLKNKKWIHNGTFIFGLGLTFFGLDFMTECMSPLRYYKPFIEFLVQLSNPFVGILFSVFFTFLIQASSATIGIAMGLAEKNLISFRVANLLVFGANVGTCGTACIASLGKPKIAQRVSVSYVIIKVIGVLITLPFLGPFESFIDWLSGDGDISRKIANSHTFFNLFTSVIFLPVTGLFSNWMTQLLPEPAEPLLPLAEGEERDDERRHRERESDT
eukprot:TRINITY_DN3704_c0_g1_i1.p1 TRINITY_DN3704_c0_g1~~TRINITY_DN3704_c0_g1_i1.p1  ORF type:complete len:345 (+),score=86.27 TRINITY_DN3704_c0_g1_i1:159-1193(+)